MKEKSVGTWWFPFRFFFSCALKRNGAKSCSPARAAFIPLLETEINVINSRGTTSATAAVVCQPWEQIKSKFLLLT